MREWRNARFSTENINDVKSVVMLTLEKIKNDSLYWQDLEITREEPDKKLFSVCVSVSIYTKTSSPASSAFLTWETNTSTFQFQHLEFLHDWNDLLECSVFTILMINPAIILTNIFSTATTDHCNYNSLSILPLLW